MGPRENVIKIKSIITVYMEVIVFDGFLYKYLCDPGKSQKKRTGLTFSYSCQICGTAVALRFWNQKGH